MEIFTRFGGGPYPGWWRAPLGLLDPLEQAALLGVVIGMVGATFMWWLL